MFASEAVPFAKTGGLGDVLGALPAALARLGHEVALFLPLHRPMRERFCPVPGLESLEVRMHDGQETAQVLRADQAPAGVSVFAVAGGTYFDRPHLYGEPTGDYADNARRFTFFCRAALAAVDRLGLDPEVLHAHDWQTALIPAYLRAGIHAGDAAAAAASRLSRAAVVFTVHNLGYQGIFPPSDFAVTGLPRGLFAVEGVEFHGRLNLLKAGLLWADHITTVSPRYAREIRTAEQGHGLEGLLARRAADLTGILNGIDDAVWNPAADPHLAAAYSAEDLHGKRRCKADLILELELDGELDAPIAALVSRLAAQKGFDVLLPVLPRLLERGLRVVVLGQGDPRIETALLDLAAQWRGRIAFRRAFDEPLAHKIHAGADLLLMPSRYEPCGLGQMMSLRYGTIPVVRATGGLLDTVVDASSAPRQGTGFCFDDYTAAALLAAADRALAAYAEPQVWRELVRRAMGCDFSWSRSAARYAQLYARVLRRGLGGTARRPRIVFGTAGWRAELADDLTFAGVGAVAQAIAEHVLEDPERPALFHQGILVARDTRFLGRELAVRAAGVLAANDIPVLWSEEPLPTPAVSFAITRRNLAAGVNLTASHNPYTWNGVKLSPAWGGAALPATTTDVEARANAWLARPRGPEWISPEEAAAVGLWHEEDFGAPYRAGLAELVDVEAIRASELRVAVDLLWGTARGHLDRLLAEWGVAGAVLHAENDATFGGGRPEPGEHELRDLARAVRAGHHLGVSTDCDADRFGIVDAGGSLVPANYVIALLLGYLSETRPRLVRRVGRSVATTHLVDAVAAACGIAVVETPVGFKFLGELLARGEILLGGEESGGLSIQGHVPEMDGILADLLVVEMVARRRTSLRAMLERLFAEVGPRVSLRRDLRPGPATLARLPERLAREPDDLAGHAVRRVVTIDGTKLVCEGDRWVLLRASGTEPVVRLYAEGTSEAEATALLDAAQQVFLT